MRTALRAFPSGETFSKHAFFSSQSVSMAMATTAFAVFTSRRESLSMRKISTLFLAMNISYRNLWNPIFGVWIAASEITLAHGKRKLWGIAAAITRLNCRLRPLNTALVLAGFLVVPGSGNAQSTDWSAGAGGDWSTGGNWTSGVPTGGTARLTNAGDQATLTGAGTVQSLEVQNSGEVVVGAGGSLVVTDIINLGTTAGAGAARLTIQQGGTVSAAHLFAGNAPRQGIVTVTGAGSSLTLAPIGVGQADRAEIGGAGAGELHIDAGANVTVNGTRTLHVGDTANGTLFIGSGAGAGTLTADSVILGTAGSSVQFNHTGTTTFSAAVSGSGSLTKTGNGTTILAGANTYTGGTTVSGGTLQGDTTSLQGNITNNAVVTFDQAANGTYAGVMTGIGTLTKTGAGNLTLSGINVYGGTTSINSGTLSVNGSIASATTINNGGTLSGIGSVGNLTVMSGGILAPGNSIGELTVNGSATLAAGSIFRVEADDAGHADKLLVNGSATINGGTVDVQASAGTYAANTTYTILNATGGRTGNFDNVTSNLAFLTSTLSYDTNNVFLNLARNNVSYSNVAVTPNQIATSTSLQGITGATGDMGNVMTTVTGLSAEQARASYDAMSGASLSAMSRAGAAFSFGVSSQMRARLAAVSGNSTSASAFGSPVQLTGNDHVYDLFSSASTASQSSPASSGLTGLGASADSSLNNYGRGFWLRGYGNYQSTSSDGNAVASRVRSNGLSVGFDTEVSDGLIVGVAGTFGKSSLRLDSNDSGRSRDRAIAAYASYKQGPWNFNGSANFAFNSSNMERQIVVGALTRTATSAFDGNTASVYGEATYDVHLQDWTLQPLAALSLSRSKTDGFTEQGAGALNLQVAGQTTNSVKTLFGAKAQFEVGQVKLEPRLAWGHEFGDANAPMTMQFAGSAAPSFLISGVKLPRDSVIAGLGISSNISKNSNGNLSLFADLQGEYNSKQSNVALLVGIRSRW